MICSIAAPWSRVPTEIHFLEKKLGMEYRKDKVFSGRTVDHSGKEHHTNVTFYCRDYGFNLRAGHAKLAEDMKKDGLMRTITLDEKLRIEGVPLREMCEYAERKIKNDYFYLCEIEHP